MTDLPPVDMRDFDIEDFIGEDGQIDLDKLRAYENEQLGMVMREMSPEAENEFQIIEEADIFIWTDDGLESLQSSDENVFTLETENPTPPADEEGYQDPWDTPTTYTSRHVYEDIEREAEEEPVWDKPQSKASAEKTEPETLSDVRSRSRSTMARIDELLGNLRSQRENSERDSENSHDEDEPHSNPKVRIMKVDLRPKSSEAERTISLSGETQIVIGKDGTLTITNNGQSVVPLAMAAGDSGKAAAMVMDNNAPAKITVNKTINIENGKRHVHVEVDMESETGGHN